MITLKNCLWGNPAVLVERTGGWTANCIWSPILQAIGQCKPCFFEGISTTLYPTAEEAAVAWNTRESDEKYEELIQRELSDNVDLKVLLARQRAVSHSLRVTANEAIEKFTAILVFLADIPEIYRPSLELVSRWKLNQALKEQTGEGIDESEDS